MKFALVLILALFVVDVKPLIQEAADVVFKKYATLKVIPLVENDLINLQY